MHLKAYNFNNSCKEKKKKIKILIATPLFKVHLGNLENSRQALST